MLCMSLPKTLSHHPVPPPHTGPPSQRSRMLTTSCSGWVTEWWMSVEGSPPQGPTGKGPHLKRQLHSAGESHRYALFWLGSAASQPAKPPSIRPTIGTGRDKITRCVVEKGISLGSYPSQMFRCGYKFGVDCSAAKWKWKWISDYIYIQFIEGLLRFIMLFRWIMILSMSVKDNFILYRTWSIQHVI